MKEMLKVFVKTFIVELLKNTVIAFVATVGTLGTIGLIGEVIEKRQEKEN